MIRTHRSLRFALLILLTITAAGCDLGSSLEPDAPEPSKPPRNVKPKELTNIGPRTREPLR